MTLTAKIETQPYLKATLRNTSSVSINSVPSMNNQSMSAGVVNYVPIGNINIRSNTEVLSSAVSRVPLFALNEILDGGTF